MKGFTIIIIIFLINAIAIVFVSHRERIKRERAKRTEIIENTKKTIKMMEEETKQFKCLLDLFNNWITIYNSDPKKSCTYEKEFLEWYEKIIVAQYEYIKSIMLNKNCDISFQNLLTILKQFEKWTEGK